MTSPLYSYRQKKALSLEALGDALNVDKTTILRWERKNVAACRVLDVERITGISRHVLRPDIFGPAKGRAA